MKYLKIFQMWVSNPLIEVKRFYQPLVELTVKVLIGRLTNRVLILWTNYIHTYMCRAISECLYKIDFNIVNTR